MSTSGAFGTLKNILVLPPDRPLKKIDEELDEQLDTNSPSFDSIKMQEILDGDKKKSIMIGDSETDANAAKAAEIPIILLKYGYTEKRSEEIYHNHIIKDFVGIEKIVSEYL